MTGIIVYCLFSIIFGVLSCFAGKRLFYPMLAVFMTATAFSVCISQFGIDLKGIIISVCVGVLTCLLSKFFYKAGVFLISALFGGVIGTIIDFFVPETYKNSRVAIIIVAALLVGICGVIWSDLFIMLSTAYNGAGCMVTPFIFLIFNFSKLESFEGKNFESTVTKLEKYLSGSFLTDYSWIIFLATIALAIVGFCYQRKAEYINEKPSNQF